MKNELGIEVKCENCDSHYRGFCDDYCCRLDTSYIRPKKDYQHFRPSENVLVQRIKELQEQQFTEEELQFIKDRLDECIEEWDMPEMVFMAHQILKKIEQTLKNSEANLKNER